MQSTSIVRGVVERGRAEARKSGYPTANLATEKLPEIMQGIYLGLASIEEGEKMPSIIFFGVPYALPDITVPRFEVHLLERDGDVYGKQMIVELVHFVRENRKFPDHDSLEKAIKEDFEIARKYFKMKEEI